MKRSLILAVSLGAGACGSDSAICDAMSLEAALMNAIAGDQIAIGACTINGHFRVPSGVTLTGAGATSSSLVSDDSTPVLITTIDPGETTTITDLRLESNGRGGLIARGGGELEIARLRVDATLGVGIAGDSLGGFRATDVVLRGPITLANVNTVPFRVTSSQSAIWGVVLLGVGVAELTRVDISQFAAAGAVFVDSNTTWVDGSASENVALGIAVQGGTFNATRVTTCATLQPVTATPVAGAVFFDQAAIDTNSFRVCDTQGPGIFQVTGTARHVELDAARNTNIGLWTDALTMLEVSGQFDANHFAGVVATNVGTVLVHDAAMTATVETVRPTDGFETKRMGDGLQLFGAMQTGAVRDVTLANNERTGMLIELEGGTIANVQLERIDATVASPMQGGVVAQNGTTPMGWDSGVTRHGNTAADDAALAGMLVPLGAVGPCDHPEDFQLRNGGFMTQIGY